MSTITPAGIASAEVFGELRVYYPVYTEKSQADFAKGNFVGSLLSENGVELTRRFKNIFVFYVVGTHNFHVPVGVTEVAVLVVAGGGSGGGGARYAGACGGGGAGGLLFVDKYAVTPGEDIEVIVGDGGPASTTRGNNGQPSKFGSIETVGGGGGGRGTHSAGRNGGSGGGGGYSNYSGGSGVGGPPRQGYNGGRGWGNTPWCAGGGGGAGEPGNPMRYTRGEGGNGLYFGNYFGDNVGEDGWFAGGGGGGSMTPTHIGGIGGGANGQRNANLNGDPGMPATGGGGGGAPNTASTRSGGKGGSGIVIVGWGRYEGARTVPPIDLSGLSSGARLRTSWKAELPAETSVKVETAVTDEIVISDEDLGVGEESFPALRFKDVPPPNNGVVPHCTYVNLGTPEALQIPSNHDFTIEGIMYLESFTSRDMIYCKNNGRAGTPYTYLFGFKDNGTKIGAYTGSAWVEKDVSLSLNTRYHLAYVFSEGTIEFFLDGVSLGTAAFSFTNTEAHTVKIGGYNPSGTDITGYMQEIRVWDIARTAQEITDNKDKRIAGNTPSLKGYWRLDKGEGNIAYDHSGNECHGEISIHGEWHSEVTEMLGKLKKRFRLDNYPAERLAVTPKVDGVPGTQFTLDGREIVFNDLHEPAGGLAVSADYTGVVWPDEVGEVQTLYLGGATDGTFELGVEGDMHELAFDVGTDEIRWVLDSVFGTGKVEVEEASDFIIRFAVLVKSSELQAGFMELVDAVNPVLTQTTAYYDGGDWIEQVEHEHISNLPSGDLTGEHLWIRQLLGWEG